MARQMSEFRKALRELAVELAQRESTVESVESTAAGIVRYRQLTALTHLPDVAVAREIVLRAVNAELRAAAIDAAMSVDRRIADISALIRAAGIDPAVLLDRLTAK